VDAGDARRSHAERDGFPADGADLRVRDRASDRTLVNIQLAPLGEPDAAEIPLVLGLLLCLVALVVAAVAALLKRPFALA
jgi:hypothetical protein